MHFATGHLHTLQLYIQKHKYTSACVCECMQKSLAVSELILASYSTYESLGQFTLSASSCGQSENTQSLLSRICFHSLVSIFIMQR